METQQMRRRVPIFAVALMSATAVVGSARWSAAAASEPPSTIEAIRTELLQLPYYSVFDFISFSYDRGTVSLFGFAYHLGLKADAERAVRRAPGVDQVVDRIEVLPPSKMDEELRWKTYYAIYRDPFLMHYAPGGAFLWGHRHPFGPGFHALGPAMFPGTEPAGSYPIHIVVKNGRITLFGVVDSESDKSLAYTKAREVPGSFGVDNQLAVESSTGEGSH